MLKKLFAAIKRSRSTTESLKAKISDMEKTTARISRNLDIIGKTMNGDRSYLTCGTCGCGGNWHYQGCEVGKARGDTMFYVKGGVADLMEKEFEAMRA